MAGDERISELDAKITIADTDLFVLMDEEATPDQTKYITGANLKAQILAGHKDLTTGVHGVGANHLAEAPAASHLVRVFTKGWTTGRFLKGAGVDTNPTEQFLLGADIPWFHEDWKADPEDAVTGWTVANTGLGGIATWGPIFLLIKTGANNPGGCRVHWDNMAKGTTEGTIIAWLTQWGGTDRTTSDCLVLNIQAGLGVPPTLATDEHYGFRVEDGAIHATSSDGAAVEDTDTGITYGSAWTGHRLVALWVSGPAVEFYVDGVLKATHSTRIPSFGLGCLYASIANDAAVDRRFTLQSINVGTI